MNNHVKLGLISALMLLASACVSGGDDEETTDTSATSTTQPSALSKQGLDPTAIQLDTPPSGTLPSDLLPPT